MRFSFMFFFVSTLSLSAFAGPPTIGPETTYYQAPLDAEGYVDYVAALNIKFGQPDALPQDNVFLGILNQTYHLYPDPDHVAKLYEALGVQPPAGDKPQFIGFIEYAEARGLPLAPPSDREGVQFGAEVQPPSSDTVNEMEERAMHAPWTAEELPEVALWLDSIQDSLDAIVEATQRSAYHAPLVRSHEQATLIEVVLPHLGIHRTIGRSLGMRARMHLGEGDLDAAIDDWAAIKRLGRFQSREPFAISNLVGLLLSTKISNDVFRLILSRPNFENKHLERMQEVLGNLPFGGTMSRIVRDGERVWRLDLLIQVSRGHADVLDIVDGTQLPGPGSEPATYTVNSRERDRLSKIISNPRFDLDRALRRINTKWDEWFGQIPNEYEKFLDFLDGVKTKFPNFGFGAEDRILRLVEGVQQDAEIAPIVDEAVDLLLSFTEPDLAIIPIRTEYQATARIALEPVALLLVKYRIDHGHYPPQLQSLVPDYIEALPVDPLSGEPLRYLRDGSGYRLYSIGMNLKDNGGVQDYDRADIVMSIPLAATE